MARRGHTKRAGLSWENREGALASFENLTPVSIGVSTQVPSTPAASAYPTVIPDRGKANVPGELIVEDSFQAAPGADAHGTVVAYTANQEGFQGTLDAITLPDPPVLQQAGTEAADLATPGQTADQARTELNTYVSDMELGLLEPATSQLQSLKAAGANHSAVNFSQAGGQARLADNLYDILLPALKPDPTNDPNAVKQANYALDNMATAFGLDAAAIRSTDPKVGPAARATFNQKLVDFVGQADHSPTIAASKAAYDKAVDGLEAPKVSVVVANGNDGALVGEMQADAGGAAPALPSDFYANPLCNSETTNVGATIYNQAANGSWSESVAGYDTPSDSLNIYAWGSIGTPQDPSNIVHWGTSVAAPRVSAAEAALHKQFPNMSNADVTSLMARDLTYKLGDYGGHPSAPVLDLDKTSAFLEHGTLPDEPK